MSTRFVRILPDLDPKADPGSRIRLDYDPEDTGTFFVTDENVLPEKVHEPNCYRVETMGKIPLTRDSARWFRDAFTELCHVLDEEDRWLQDAVELETKAGGFPGVSGAARHMCRNEKKP